MYSERFSKETFLNGGQEREISYVSLARYAAFMQLNMLILVIPINMRRS